MRQIDSRRMPEISGLLRGESGELRDWLANPTTRLLRICLSTIVLGFGSYGLTVGLWRVPLMGLYVAFKLPTLIFLTLACNAMINGLLGMLLGSGLGFRQSLLAQLMGFSLAAMILGSIAPVTFFMALNAPPSDSPDAAAAHANFMVIHTLLIAFAGVMANLHLARTLLAHTSSKGITAMTLLAWIGGNAFLGAQFSWILRPFFGTPSLEVTFLRDDPMRGTFYETIWRSMNSVTNGQAWAVLIIALLGFCILHLPLLNLLSNPNKENHE